MLAIFWRASSERGKERTKEHRHPPPHPTMSHRVESLVVFKRVERPLQSFPDATGEPASTDGFVHGDGRLAKTLQTTLGPSNLRPQTPPEDSGPTPPYEGPGSRLGRS